MARATRTVWSTAFLFVGCCPTAGSTSSPSGAMVAASLSIKKSKPGRATERQELCKAVKGDEAKANGLKRERKTIQDVKILTVSSAKKHPREPLHWWFLLWEDQGEEGEEVMAYMNTLCFPVQEINRLAPGLPITTERLWVAPQRVRKSSLPKMTIKLWCCQQYERPIHTVSSLDISLHSQYVKNQKKHFLTPAI